MTGLIPFLPMLCLSAMCMRASPSLPLRSRGAARGRKGLPRPPRQRSAALAESEPTTAAISSGSQAVTPRVLPDLRTAAREEKRDDVRKPRRNVAANRSTEGHPRKKAPAKPAPGSCRWTSHRGRSGHVLQRSRRGGYGAQSPYERIQNKTSSWPTLEGAAVTEGVLGSSDLIT